MSEFIQALQSVREVFVGFPKRYELNQEELKKIESEIQDILHVIELTSFNAYQGFKYSKELQRLRNARRLLKDEQEKLEQVVKELFSFQKLTEKNINKVIGDIRNVETKHNARYYKMRVRKDLQELMK